MADPTETFGLKLAVRTSESPDTYTYIGGIDEFGQLFSFTSAEIDVSDISDTVKKYLGGRLDPGGVNFTLKLDVGDPQHDASTGLLALAQVRGTEKFVIEIPPSIGTSSVVSYVLLDAFVSNVTPAGAGEDVIRAQCTLRISGAPTFTTVAPTFA
ncbi:MAG: hypothetical protein AAGC81_01860 [Pseudomonadota bacterium]